MPVAVEPRRKTCGIIRSPCGRCANCANDAWGDVWRSLSDEARAWVVSEFLRTLLWADETATVRDAEYLAGPALIHYVLR